ncbi:hypothetical protein [Bacillus thuringiensis]|uniref:hypothetical protein n=1 Tax=Bacillus thuringiensis TaxID=1428 RepID=UPI000BEC2939|nr:hypothetical protein [Bacillus thuringiensis]PEC13560.1 hypothetical protein CON19_28125 [Bacillus thuringiensis]PGV72096.1 hypothetical protein COD96_06410 [Bacillus thuringiensis]
MVIPFQIRRGDEILGVISSFVNCFEVYRDVRHIALKCKINLYFGVGFGTLDTKRITDINCINGSAVINACRAVDNYLKNNSEEMIFNYCQKNQPVKFFALGGENIPYEAINALVYTIYNELIDSEQQRELIQLIELHPEMTYEEIGVNLGYNINNAKSNVTTILARSKYKEYVQMQKALLKFLQKLQKIMNACM